MSQRPTYVTDANIWIDLHSGNLVEDALPQRVAQGLMRMIQSRRRLPEAECQKRLRLWADQK